MKLILGFIACLTFTSATWSQETVAEFKWNDIVQTVASNNNATPVPLDKVPEYQEICEKLIVLQAIEKTLLGLYRTNDPQVQNERMQIAETEARKKELEKNYPGVIALLQRGVTAVLLDGRVALEIVNTNDTPLPLQLTLLSVAQPKISAQKYAVQGELRYDSAPLNAGVLEMVSYFQPDQPGLIRDEIIGPMIGGWSPFSLGFDCAAAGESGPPTRLEIKIFVNGRSTVYVGPIKLVQYPNAKPAAYGGSGMVWFYGNTTNPWWSVRPSIWAGNVETGILLGFGFLMGALCWKGKGRGFVTALLRIHIGLGVLCGVAGIVALAQHQPFIVWFPLSLSGILLVTIYSILLATLGKAYQELELRRMQALDASGFQ